ncbi:FeoA family protein [Aquisphaera insulae]|uniref:FeoA family protein n=1 Tax=Aquisphaera insulae TaxID=2712864 RepID=UPI0013EB32E0|nr:FeoA family protein [Aquisphaera insulae]
MKASGHTAGAGVMAEVVPLGSLRAGERGLVGEILGRCDQVHRLRELGMHDGAHVQMIRPGSPCIIGLRGQRLGFRMDECACVLVRPIHAAS